MRPATCSVGLVSPRSTWLSIGALTPERSARSRSERSIASRRARTREPMTECTASAMIRTYVIAYERAIGSRAHVRRRARRRGDARERSRSLRVVGRFVYPDVLVLAGGGVVGEAWMTGVLAGIEDGAEIDL